MRKRTLKNIVPIAISLSFVFAAFVADSKAQDAFREFDRKMVATPAELFEALSTFQPAGQRKNQIDEERLKEIGDAGRELLSKLSPDQQDKAWEFAEKYLRKNGVDSASSQKLMKDFGLPPEMQSELSKQFRKFGDRFSDPSSQTQGEPGDRISDLLRRAKEQFKSGSGKAPDSSNGNPQSGEAGSDVSKFPGADLGSDGERNNKTDALSDGLKNGSGDRKTSNQNSSGQDLSSSQRKSREVSGDANRNGRKNEGEFGNRAGEGSQAGRKNEKANPNESSESANPFDSSKPQPSSTENGPSESNRDSGSVLDRQKTDGNAADQAGNPTRNSDEDLQQLLKKFSDLRKNAKNEKRGGERSGEGVGEGVALADDLDWETLIKKLAEDGAGMRSDSAKKQSADLSASSVSDSMRRALELAKSDGGELAGDQNKGEKTGALDEGLLKRAKELFSGSSDSETGSGSSSNGWNSSTPAEPEERLDSRFNRLVVKAAERTLRSADKEEGVAQSVSSAFGSLIERIQEKATGEKSDREQGRADSRSAERKSRRTQNDGGTDSSGDNVQSGDQGAGWSQDQEFESRSLLPQESSMTSDSNGSGFDPKGMLDSIPDLSAINPTQVFTFFAIVGLVLFVGYFLLQSLVGNESSVIKRSVVKQIRQAKIESPKDLIETVDVFLLNKFGIKASWWNAKIAQTVLASGSPELRNQVDDLMKDYVRARYMREDVRTSNADQQRYKKTLEELSLLDFKPSKSLRVSEPSTVQGSPVPAEG
jgi:hypothetical protein